MKTFLSAEREKQTQQNCEQNAPDLKTVQCKGYAARTDYSAPIQRKGGGGGLPSKLKSGVESLSGFDMSDVKVHYNSEKPAGLKAHAYAQGSDIHLAPGQERHLPHEAWHVVQQRQGRVKPTKQLKGVGLNDSASLEREADVQGAKANNHRASGSKVNQLRASGGGAVQAKKYSSTSDAPVQRQEHLATGLKKKAAVGRYAAKSKARIAGDKNPLGGNKKWATLTDQQRADKMVKYVNSELEKAHVPKIKQAVHSATETQPSFRSSTWDMQLVGDMSRTDDAYVDWLVDVVYHESRHAEQNFRMARVKAGEGKTATEIAADLFMPADVAAAAVKRPLKAQSKTSKFFHSKDYNERHAKKLSEADEWYQSIYGTGAGHRNSVYADINNRMPEYEALPEEADAYIVGPMAKTKFKTLMGR
jgi:hypothetical protein